MLQILFFAACFWFGCRIRDWMGKDDGKLDYRDPRAVEETNRILRSMK